MWAGSLKRWREGKKEGRKDRRKEGTKKGKREGREEKRKGGRKKCRKDRRKVGRTEGRKEQRKDRRKVGKIEGRKEGTKQGKKEGRIRRKRTQEGMWARLLLLAGQFWPTGHMFDTPGLNLSWVCHAGSQHFLLCFFQRKYLKTALYLEVKMKMKM